MGLAAYDAALAKVAGFRARPGQRVMAQHVARALATGDLGETGAAPQRSIAVIEAGTGVGKSAGYIAPGVAIARARKTRLLIATSTTALQEQLVSKDLPMISASMDQPFTFALAKGRGRYVCKDKLLRRAGLEAGGSDLLDLDDEPAVEVANAVASSSRVTLYRTMADALNTGWDGDRDTLGEPPAPEAWSPVAAERNTCTVRACPHFEGCSYYQARRKLAQVDVIVANHSLVLASLQAPILPDLSDTLVVFDEAHHLPAIAIEQLACSMDLTRLRWIDKVPKGLTSVAAELNIPVEAPLERLSRELRTALEDSGRILMDNLSSGMRAQDGVRRFLEGEVELLLGEALRLIEAHAGALHDVAASLAGQLREQLKEAGGPAPRLTALFGVLGSLSTRLDNIKRTAQTLLTTGTEAKKTAKWVAVDTRGQFIGLQLHASPILPGELLIYNLWHKVRAAVLTSATLRSCGSFDYFLKEAGLDKDPGVWSTKVASPFNHAEQGTIVVRQTKAQPKNLAAYNEEVASLLAADVEAMTAGGLALFTSRRHLDQAYAALPDDVRPRVLVQGSMSRGALLAEHRRRVQAGQPSAIFGLQSFAEGLDLPGDLCADVWVAKLPFATPNDPVGETRAEYVQACGGDPFDELVVPQTGVRLLQWTGRAIRTETDKARIHVFDRRITEKAFGRRLLKGLPPYPVQVVPAPT